MSSRTPWILLAAIGSGLLVIAMVIVVVSELPLSSNVYLPGLVAFPLVGGLVLMSRPDNRIGRMLVMAGFWFALATAAQTYFWLRPESGPLPGQFAAGWVATWAYWPAGLLLLLLVASFPSGRVKSSWLRRLVGVAVVATAVLTLALMILPEPVNSVFFSPDVVNPWAIVEWLPSPTPGEVLPVLFTVLLAVALVDLFIRWRRSRDAERFQMRWFGLGIVICVTLAIAAFVVQAAGLDALYFWVAFWGLGFGILPVSIGVAVTRYRLYDIDRIVSRTVSYGLVVGLLASLFAGIVIGLPRLLGLPDESPLLVAAATLAAAGLFNPLRRRVQAGVDRRFNRTHYDAQREVDRFAERLRTELELEDLTDEVLVVLGNTVQPANASVWIRGEGLDR